MGPVMRVPHIDDSSFSETDRQHVDSIQLLLYALDGFISRLRSDLGLFDYAAKRAFQPHQPTARRHWIHIAARDATITLWDFGDALTQLESTVRSCEPLRTKQRVTALRVAKGQFGNAFPDARRMRRVSAHPVGHFSTPQARRNNAHRRMLGYGNIRNRTIEHTHEGRRISFDLSEETITKLEAICTAVFNAFRA